MQKVALGFQTRLPPAKRSCHRFLFLLLLNALEAISCFQLGLQQTREQFCLGLFAIQDHMADQVTLWTLDNEASVLELFDKVMALGPKL